ncbi:hypothetical protein PENTCL1PPCAC_6201, partial [Pristionchus entomophagus]
SYRMSRQRLRGARDTLDKLLDDSASSRDGKSSKLLPFHPKNAPKEEEGEALEPFSSEFARQHGLLLAAAHSIHQKHEVALLLRMLTNTITVVAGGKRVRYRVLMALNMFKSSGSTPKDAEVESAKAGLFENADLYEKATLDLILELITRLRTIVGMKSLHESASLCWSRVCGRPDIVPDPPIVPIKQTGAVSPFHTEELILSAMARDTMNGIERVLAVGTSVSTVEMESHDHSLDYIPDELIWRNAEVETKTEEK